MRVNKKTMIVGAAISLLLSSQALAQAPLPVVADHQQPGSFLVFPKFDIRNAATTQLRITNLLDLKDVKVKINYVCPGVKHGDDRCRALDRRITLTPRETRIVDVAEHNPSMRRGFRGSVCVERQAAYANLVQLPDRQLPHHQRPQKRS
jgi:hypothetical protein